MKILYMTGRIVLSILLVLGMLVEAEGASVTVTGSNLPLNFSTVGEQLSSDFNLDLMDIVSAMLTVSILDLDELAEAEMYVSTTIVSLPDTLLSNDLTMTDTIDLDLGLLSGGNNTITFEFADDLGGSTGGYSVVDLKITLIEEDLTPPADIGDVRDGTGTDIDLTGSLIQLSANWDASSDPDSGILKYIYAIGTPQGGAGIVEWTDNGNVTNVTHTGLSLTVGTTYYFTVKAVNGVNLEGNAANSDGQCVMQVAGDEYLWLHVEGRYIRTSSYADPPNEIFVAAGIAYREHTSNGTNQAILDWAKERYTNCIRLDIYGYKDYNFSNVSNIISNDIDPWIQSAKSNQVYTYLDCHEYFHQPPWQDGWFPVGPLWDDVTFQAWIDYWVTIADYYKNEPWVLGYELCNEPHTVAPDVSRYWYTECIKAIRQVDTRHIILLGNDNLTHTVNMEEVWGPVNFRPDEPYSQVVFAFHEYTNAVNPNITAPVIDYVQDRFNVPVHCTEFGSAEVAGGVAEETKRQFEIDMFAMFGPRYIGWSIWVLNGVCPNGSLEYENIWVPAAADQGSSIPVPGGVPQASKIVCGTYPEYVYFHGGTLNYIVADGSSATVKATICDEYGCRIPAATDSISFSISGEGSWEDGTTGVKSVNARDGIATINLRSTSTPGTITVNASAGILTPGSVEVTTFGTPNKLSCSAKLDSLPADGASLSHIAARIEDNWGNAVQIAQNAVTFSLEGSGSLWMTDTMQGNTGVMEDGVGNIFVKAGIIDEIIKVTASADGLLSDSVNVYIGNVEKPDENDNPFDNVKVYPNPFNLGGGSDKITFTSLPEESVLRIYTLSGKLVRTLHEDGSREIMWDGKNSDGEGVTTGIYVYLLTDGQGSKIYRGNKRTGKILLNK